MSKIRSFFIRLGSAKEAFRSPRAWEDAKRGAAGLPPLPSPEEAKPEPIKEDNPECRSIATLKSMYCCGCAACANLCPTKAITMENNDEGFLEPLVDEEKCTSCGLCKKRCPSLNTKYSNNPEPTCYAAYGSDEIRAKSSSGGLFALLAEYVFSQSGAVCGAGYTEDFKVRHMIIESPEELDKLRLSKYVQSDPADVYTEIGKLLKEKRKVLFCGCGCQVAGLYAYLGKKPKNLLTIDLMCHGGPSPKLFEKYLKDYHGKKPIKRIGFRDKDFYGWSTEMTVEYEDGEVYHQRREIDPFYRGFLPCISVREFCGECIFSALPRQGDITLADFWGIERYNPEYTDGKGTSIVSVNSKVGEKALDAIKDKLLVCAEVPCEDIKKTGQPYQHPFARNPQRYPFFDLIKKGASIEKALDYAQNRKFDVLLAGVWYGNNYGSIATYYALKKTVESFGLSVLMLNKPFCRDDDPEIAPDREAIKFAKAHGYEVSRIYNRRDIKGLNHHIDTFLMGSDQMFNRSINRWGGYVFYFDYVDEEKKKIAYATSLGHNMDFSNPDERPSLEHFLSRFDAISMREDTGMRYMNKTYGLNSVQVLDPVFIADRKIFDDVALESRFARPDYDFKTDEQLNFKERPGDGYILAYILDLTHDKLRAIRWISEQLNKPVRLIGNGDKWIYKTDGDSEDLVEVTDVTEGDWIYSIKHCDFMITDSCHGMSFALIYEKDFIATVNMFRGCWRFFSLCELLGVVDHMVHNKEIPNIPEHPELLNPVDYKAVNEKLNSEREKSLKWLKDALFGPKIIKKSHVVYKIVDEHLD